MESNMKPQMESENASTITSPPPLFPPLVRLTKPEWKKLTDKQRWDVLVAMRGPDLEHDRFLKWMTTAVIRHRVWDIVKASGGSATVNTKLPFVVLPDHFRQPVPVTAFNFSHFIGHIIDAAAVLGIPVVMAPIMSWWQVVYGSTAPSNLKLEDLEATKIWLASIQKVQP